MATESLACPTALPISRPLVDRLHERVTTVDHKRLGILYIGYALVFLCIGGIEATIMRVQLMVPHNDLVSPQVFNRLFTMHEVGTRAALPAVVDGGFAIGAIADEEPGIRRPPGSRIRQARASREERGP